MQMAKRWESFVELELEHGFVWQKIDIPHTIGQVFQRLQLLMANRNLLGKLY
jgi:hypothetical protein